MKIYVGGVNAVGKSTLIKKAAEALGFEYIHAASGLLNSFGFDGDYEKLRALTQKERDIKLAEYVEDLCKNNPDKNFFFDSHYLVLVRGKVEVVTDFWLSFFDKLVLVSAPIDDVFNRILEDSKTRDRALFPIGLSEEESKEMLNVYQSQTLTEFLRLEKVYQKPAVEIMNKQGLMDSAVGDLVDFIKTSQNS